MNNLFIDLAASLSFYIIPYLTGRIFVKKTVQAYLLGALLWFVTYFVVFAVNAFVKFDFQSVIRAIIAIVSAFSLLKLGREFVREKPKIHWQNAFIVLFLAGMTSFVYFFVWKRNTPYPLQLDWDIYEHIALANLISSGKLSFLATRISDTFTFNGYSPIFAILLSLPKILFQRGLLGIYWGLEYWHYLLTALAAFILAKRVFSNNWLAFLSAIISSLVFESIVVYSALFLIPQTLVALLTIFVAAEIREYRRWVMLLIAGAVILLAHYVVGALCLLILAVLTLSSHFSFPKKSVNLAILASSLFLLISAVSNLFIKWSVLGIEEAGHFNFQLITKLGFLTDWYGIFLFVFGLIGCLKIVKNGSYGQKILLCLALIVLGIALLPFSYFLKFYVLGHYFWSLIITLGVWVLISNLSSVLKFFSIAFVTFVLLITFYKNQLVYKQPLSFNTYETQISYAEIQAANWLSSQNKDGKAFLISDPATQYVLEAVSGVNSQGGAYMNLKTRRILESVNGYCNLNFIESRLLSIKDSILKQKPEKTFFVASGRYFAWQNLPESQKDSTFYNIWSPKEITAADQTYIDYYKRVGFNVVFSNKEIVIFSL